jgi:hypothetical protein
VEKNTVELNALQAQRKAAIAQVEAEALALVQLAQEKGGFDPADYFPPESQPLGSFFQGPRSSVNSSAATASFTPKSPK